MRRFHFLPSWRTDDIMISYAADNGSVGPHYDHYDVFLLQLEGRRRWQVGSLCNEDSPTLPGTPLKVLAEFAPLEDWTLEPGDMLYLPPRLAHWGRGVGVGCMTLSVGFRAPSVGTLLQDWAAEISPGLREDQRFEDPERVPVVEPACIESEDIDRLQALLVQLVSDRAALASWFGKLMTEPKYPDQIEGDDWPWIEDVMAGADLVHHPGARFAWSRSPAMLFASGEAFAVPAGFAALVAGQTVLDMGALQPWWQDCDCLAVLNALVLSGSLQVCSVQSGDEQELGARCYPAG
jgi:50S ribosomal protein L16 3-hydroxylase